MESKLNITTTPLRAGAFFQGQYEDVSAFNSILISCLCDTTAEIVCWQSQNKVQQKTTTFQVVAGQYNSFSISVNDLPYFYITCRNNSGIAGALLNLSVRFSASQVIVAEIPTKSSFTLWATPGSGINGVSSVLDLSSKLTNSLTIYGNSSQATTLTIQFSNDNTTFYSSQYAYTLSSGGDWGFTVNSSPKYLRLISSANSAINAICNYH
jgi:hypothetical protein